MMKNRWYYIRRRKKKLKYTFYAVTMCYMAVALVLCLSIWQRKAEWSEDLRLYFNLGILEVGRLVVWGNAVSIVLLMLLWFMENVHIRRLNKRNKKLEKQLQEFKKELKPTHPQEVRESEDNKVRDGG